MTGKWLIRTGLLCLLGGIVLILLSCVGLALHEWVWPPFVSGVALLIPGQILIALSDVIRRLQSLEDSVRNVR